MPEDKATTMREFVKAMAAGEVEKALSCTADEPVWATPLGTYEGKEAVKSSLTSMAKNMKDMKVTETGNGIIVHGDKAFFEHILSGTYQGKKFEFLAMCAYEFSGDKIKKMRTTYDRLLMAQQVTPWFGRPVINMIVGQSAKAVK